MSYFPGGMCVARGWGTYLWYPGVAGLRLPDNGLSHGKGFEMNNISYNLVSVFKIVVHWDSLFVSYSMPPATEAVQIPRAKSNQLY